MRRMCVLTGKIRRTARRRAGAGQRESGERAGRPGWAFGDPGERGPGHTRRVCALPTFGAPQTLEKRTLDFRDTAVLRGGAFSARRFCGMSFLRDGASTRWRFHSTPLLQRDGSAEWRALEPRFPTAAASKKSRSPKGNGTSRARVMTRATRRQPRSRPQPQRRSPRQEPPRPSWRPRQRPSSRTQRHAWPSRRAWPRARQPAWQRAPRRPWP